MVSNQFWLTFGHTLCIGLIVCADYRLQNTGLTMKTRRSGWQNGPTQVITVMAPSGVNDDNDQVVLPCQERGPKTQNLNYDTY